MRTRSFAARTSSIALLAAMLAAPIVSLAQQTRITAPKNKYQVQQDVKLGDQAAAEVERQFPIIDDPDATEYIESVGRRLVDAIPPELQQSAFNYRFKWVNASDINAFALPGGPMYVNRGMILAAKNEGEMAGVMAHEISHVALRHATAQATKQSSAKSTLSTIGLILGGAVLGGNAGAQLGAGLAGVMHARYSREYESQADILGAQIMARAGYDPSDLANMFRTIEQQSGGGGPEWLSDHPNPGNRYAAITREAQYLNVSKPAIKLTRDFERIQSRFRGLPRARSMSEIERGSPSGVQNGGSTSTTTTGSRTESPTSSGRYSATVAAPSARTRPFSLDWIELAVPSNWRDFVGNDGVQFAPEGAYGGQGITRGLMIGAYNGQSSDAVSSSDAYLAEVLQSNPYLRQRGRFMRTTVAGRTGYVGSASGISPVTGRSEIITVYTTQLRNGQLFYAVTVVPENETFTYNSVFRSVLSSIRLEEM